MPATQLHRQNADNTQPRKRNKKRLILMLLVASLFVLLLVVLYPHAKVAYLAYRIQAARTAHEERVAFALVSKWSPHGTVIAMLDSKGNNLGALGTFDYADVRAVEIRWPCGRILRHDLLDKENLASLVGE